MESIYQKHGVEEGDLLRFKETGVVATVIEVSDGWVRLYVGCGSLDGTPSHTGFTGMTMTMVHRTAEVINESR
jgi:hypothetical protein